MENKKMTDKLIYMFAIFYVISVYVFSYLCCKNIKNLPLQVLAWPIVLAILNLLVVCIGRKKWSRNQLLNCTIIIKYGLIPFFILGGLIIACFFLISFIPVPFMTFIGLPMAIGLSVFGWIVMLGGVPVSLAYIIKSRKEGVHGNIISVITGFMQFFFSLDVIAIMILSLKEKRWVKLTISIIVILVLATILGILGIVLALMTGLQAN